MSSAERNGRERMQMKAMPSSDGVVQLIAFARILARQTARQAIAARNASPRQDE